MKKTTLVIALCIILWTGTALAENPCVVTKATGTNVGSLPHAALYCTGTITFSGVSSVTVTEPLTFHMNENVVLDGKKTVTIKGSGFQDALVISVVDGITIKNVTLEHKGEVCIVLTGFNGMVKNSTIKSCPKGIVVSSGDNNELTQNIFDGVATPISLEDEGNMNMAGPDDLTTEMYDLSQWELAGNKWKENTARIEIYKKVSNKLSYMASINEDTGIETTGEDFNFLLEWKAFPPLDTYRLIFVDSNLNTSAFSEEITPVDEGGFLPPEYESCTDVDWFWTTGFDGDSDSDGLSNGDEDSNNNCAVDEDETEPVDNDSDDDNIKDGADNCPLIENSNQDDDNENGIGNACDTPEVEIVDLDGDGIVDTDDNCPTISNANQNDNDGDNKGDPCDSDDDDDQVPDMMDNCSLSANTNQEDIDLDNIGNICDPDTDGDGIINGSDACPMDKLNVCPDASTSNPPVAGKKGEGCTLSTSNAGNTNFILVLMLITLPAVIFSALKKWRLR